MQDHDSVQNQPPAEESHPSKVMPQSVIAGLAAVVLLVGGGVAWWTWSAFTSKSTAPTVQSSNLPTEQAPAAQTVQIYWLKTTGNKIELAPSSAALNVANQPDAILQAALEKMLQGSGDPALTSTIPPGTKLLGVETKPDGVHVDLSQPFTSGGGSTSMMGRVAQVIYTASTLDPNAKVWISVDGKPLETLGGEGLLLDQPMTRKSFEENFTL
jgi:spore germination protein GerM